MQRLLSLFVAIALLVVPMGMISGAAAAHAGNPHATMAPADCHDGAPMPEKKSKGLGMSAQCALACAALPAVPVGLGAPAELPPVVHPMVALNGLAKAGPESLDPPPRTRSRNLDIILFLENQHEDRSDCARDRDRFARPRATS